MRLTTGVIALALLSSSAMSAANIDSALAALNDVGPKSAGTAQATTAWQELAKSNADEIPALLAAIDDENPLAANWIRAAVETIAEREAGKLPGDALETFVTQTDHSPRARRLAYELLLRSDPKANDRLLPKLLHDPSVELRRDAVAWKLRQLEAVEAKPELIAGYQSAFDAAVDDDQVKEIAASLKKLGEEVDIARHYGFILNWHLVGPFDNADEAGFDKPLGPEGSVVDLAETFSGSHDVGEVAWKEFTSEDDYGRVDINKVVGKHKSAICYAVSTFNSDVARPIELRWKSKNAGKLWLNGKLIDAREVYHSDGGPSLDQYTALGQLQKGENTILLKLCQNDQNEPWAQVWAFQLRVCDSAGAAIHSAMSEKR